MSDDLALATITQVGTATQATMAQLDGASTPTNVWTGSEVVTVGERVVLKHVGSELFIVGARKLSPVYHEEAVPTTYTMTSGFQALPIGTTTLKGNLASSITSGGTFTAPASGVYSIGFSVHSATVTSASQRCLAVLSSGSLGSGTEYARQGTSGTVVNADLCVSMKKFLAAGATVYFCVYASGNFVGASLIGGTLWSTLDRPMT